VVPFLPGPLVYSNLGYFAFVGQRKLQDATDTGFGCRRHSKGLGNLRGIGSIRHHSHRLENLDKPISHASITLNESWKAFRKDLSGARCLWADPLAHQ
jgi:hypothetical protein